MKIKNLKKGNLYKVTFIEKLSIGLYDNAVYPNRIKITEGESNFCIAIFDGYSDISFVGASIPVWKIIAAPWKMKTAAGLGADKLAISIKKIKKIEPFNKEDLPLYVNEYITAHYDKLVKED